MSELISSVEFKKADGQPITFNFQFENGLPIKPLLIVNGSIWYSSKDNCYGVSIILTKDDLKECDSKVHEQNQKIEDMKVEVTYIEPKSIEKVKNVFIKDSTCESELKAYKELFNE